jgi:hypothetical protein
MSAFQAGYEGSIPFTRSINQINKLGSNHFSNTAEISGFATKY